MPTAPLDDAAIAAFWIAAGRPPSGPTTTRLGAVVATAHAALADDVVVVPARLCGYLGQRCAAAAPDDVDAWLAEVDGAELALVCACLDGDAAALRRFDRDYLREAKVGAARIGASPSEQDEITQEVRRQLLAPRLDGPPRLAGLTARGDLRALVRLVAVRAGLSLRRARGREVALDDDAPALVDDAAAPWLVVARSEHRALFARALAAALARLEPRTRTALKLHSIDGVPLAQVARMFQVDRSTVARWIAAARDDILVETRRQLAVEAGVPTDQFESFVDLLRSDFAVSLRRLLDAGGSGEHADPSADSS